MEFKGKILDRFGFIEPIYIEKGDKRLGLGQLLQPPNHSCRVVAEGQYQDMKLAYDLAPELLEALKGLIDPLTGLVVDGVWKVVGGEACYNIEQAIEKALK